MAESSDKNRLTMRQRLGEFVARKALEWSGSYTLRDSRLGKLLGGTTTYTGRTVDTDVAMTVSTVWACVRIISEALGSLPVHVMKRQPKGAVVADDHPLADVLIGSPNAEMTSGELRESIGAGLCLQGNSYQFKEMGARGRVLSLTPLPPSNVQPQRNKDSGTIEYRVLDRGQWETYPADKLWHVRGFGSDGLMGLSPVGLMRQALGLSLACEEFGARFFGQGARPASIIEIPDWLQDDQREAAYKRLDELYSGLDNAHKAFILEGGMKHVPVNMPLDDAQFILTRKFQIAELCRIWRVPLHMVQEMEGSTNNNIEWQGTSLATHTLLPYFTRIEQSISKWLLPPGDRGTYFVRFNYEGMLRADTQSRGDFYTKMLQNGVYSINEVRARENLPAIDGLDEHIVQTNQTPADLLAALIQSQISKTNNSNGAS